MKLILFLCVVTIANIIFMNRELHTIWKQLNGLAKILNEQGKILMYYSERIVELESKLKESK